MNRLLLIPGLLFFIGACSSGSGCGGDEKKAPAAGQSTSLPSGSSHGGTSELVSFQGLGKKAPGDIAPGGQVGTAAAALGGSGATADPQESVICGGFPNLAADCKTDPLYDRVLKKCCPAGSVDLCQAIPGGARLIGHRCTAPIGGPVAAPAK